MAKCDFCETGILFRGVHDRGMVYCDANCQRRGRLLTRIEDLPLSLFDRIINAIQRQKCSKCGGPGPIDVHTHYTVFSILVLTIHNSHQQICCGKCGVRSKVNGILLSGLLGWWGLPGGLIWTPIQIVRNLSGLFGGTRAADRSSELLHLAHLLMVESMIASGTEFPEEPKQEIEYAEEDD